MATVQDPPPVDIILDSQLGGSAVSVISGSFSSLTNTASYGGSALAGTSTSTSIVFRFTPQLTAAGYYKVSGFWPALSENATDVSVAVHHDGATDTLSVDQTIGGGVWNDLGAYYFAADGSEYIEFSSPKKLPLVADAVRLQTVVVTPLIVQTEALPAAYVGVP